MTVNPLWMVRNIATIQLTVKLSHLCQKPIWLFKKKIFFVPLASYRNVTNESEKICSFNFDIDMTKRNTYSNHEGWCIIICNYDIEYFQCYAD